MFTLVHIKIDKFWEMVEEILSFSYPWSSIFLDDSADVMGASPKLASIRGSVAASPPKVSKVPSRFDAALQDEDSCDAVAAPSIRSVH